MSILITEHCRKRMKQRLITYSDILETISQGQQEAEEESKIKYISNDLVVVAATHEHDIIIVTAYYTHSFSHKAEKLAKKRNISFRQSIKIIRGIE